MVFSSVAAQVAQLLAADALRTEQLGAARAELAAARAALEARDAQACARPCIV